MNIFIYTYLFHLKCDGHILFSGVETRVETSPVFLQLLIMKEEATSPKEKEQKTEIETSVQWMW